MNIQGSKPSHEVRPYIDGRIYTNRQAHLFFYFEQVQHLTLLSVELHVRTRKDLRPDPEFDSICAIFYHVQTDSRLPEGKNQLTGIICVDKKSERIAKRTTDQSISSSELNTSSIASQTKEKRTFLERSGNSSTNTWTKGEGTLRIEERKRYFVLLGLGREWREGWEEVHITSLRIMVH